MLSTAPDSLPQWRVTVAVPVPLFHGLDYLTTDLHLLPGCRVRVPLGQRQVIGIVLDRPRQADADGMNCKPVTECIDVEPLLPAELMALCGWTSSYYHHPISEVLAAALPAPLRQARALRSLKARATTTVMTPAPQLTAEQGAVLARLGDNPPGFCASLIEGVTGSGKTEIYLRRVAEVLAAGQQALVLTPEIGLTPQLTDRFRSRFGAVVAAFHSGLTDRARAEAWLAARAGRASVVIGTRSAVFVPLPRLGLVVIDEEHDASYKQQDGLRYSARDVAVMRAQKAQVPVLLGSATPSLETLHNARQNRYRHFRLHFGTHLRDAATPVLLDVRRLPLQDGLSAPLLDAAARHLDAGDQVLLFVNRRGYAPALLCHECGWTAACAHCDARLTLHRTRGRLICHHCGNQTTVPARCGECGSTPLLALGQGTERIEQRLRERFPASRIERIDSDRSGGARELERVLSAARSGTVGVLVGTQMLAKGHDLAGLTLVGVVAADQALYSADFRATERLGQILTQVAGRAGRGAKPGEVIVQTHQPEHPHLQRWLRDGYAGLARALLEERRTAHLPPFAALAMIRADALDADAPLVFLRRVAASISDAAVECLGPVPAPMERRAARIRAQLLLRARSRSHLQHLLTELAPRLSSLPGARRVRWSVDVDPVDLY